MNIGLKGSHPHGIKTEKEINNNNTYMDDKNKKSGGIMLGTWKTKV